MDEYADENGNTAPREWKGGFQYWMWHDFFSRLDPDLRIPEEQIHFPSTQNVNDYSKMLEDLGGADICYGGTGWGGHIAFFEPHLGFEFGDDIDAYLQAGTRIVDLHPITICQNCLYADAGSAGDWSWVPPKAATIGPKDLAGSKLVSFWNGFTAGEGAWQRFISRLAAHGPVTPLVPASILQILNSQLTLSGEIAADCSADTFERKHYLGVTQTSED
jgi:glucosamine-6-phosphate deaminase